MATNSLSWARISRRRNNIEPPEVNRKNAACGHGDLLRKRGWDTQTRQIVPACTQGVHSITWRAKYGGTDVPDARRLRELEAENNKLKKLLTEVQWDIHAWRIQPVDATHSLNISAGVWKPSVFRGLSFNCLAIALS